MSSSQQSKLGKWSEPQVADYIQEYANQVKEQAQKATLKEVGEFKSYVVTLFIQQHMQDVNGTNYCMKVDTGNGDDKFVDVQFIMPHPYPDWPPWGGVGPVLLPDFEAAKQTTKDTPLIPIKDK